MNLVTLDEARDHLRIDDFDGDGGPDDAWLNLMIPAVSGAVARWLKDEWKLYEPQYDSSGDIVLDEDDAPVPEVDDELNPVVNPTVKAAVLIELASLFTFRHGEGKDNVVPSSDGHGYVLNKTSTALLTPLRRPTAV